MKKTIKKLQQYITTIKTVVISKLCVSLKKDTDFLCENEKIGKFEKIKNIEHMLMTFAEFENANTLFQRLLNDIDDLSEIRSILIEEMNKLPENKRYDFLRHISTLFLNIYLNDYRRGEVGKQKSTAVRQIIYDLIILNNY